MGESDVVVLMGEVRAINAKLDNLTDVVERLRDEGFPRCARNENSIEHLRKDLVLAHDRISGVKRLLLAGLVAVAGWLVNFAWSLLQPSLKH